MFSNSKSNKRLEKTASITELKSIQYPVKLWIRKPLILSKAHGVSMT